MNHPSPPALAPCPFGCGPYYLNLRMTGKRLGCVECAKCGSTGPEREHQQAAIDSWNHRPTCQPSPESEGAKCGTCGGSKVVGNGGSMNHGEFITQPCPDCAEQVTDERLEKVRRYAENCIPGDGSMIPLHVLTDAWAIIQRLRRSQPGEREGWFLPRNRINDIEAMSVDEQIKRTKVAHFTNLKVRINGKWEEHEADWIKHMARERE